MARTDADAVSRSIMEEVGKGRVAPVYLFMGTEPYYPDLVCDFIVRHALGDAERDFNQSVWQSVRPSVRQGVGINQCKDTNFQPDAGIPPLRILFRFL